MFHPYKNYVLLETVPFETKSVSGLVIANPKHVPWQDGFVREIGHACSEAFTKLGIGVRVTFRNYKEVHRWTESDDKEYVLILEDDIALAYPG